MDNYPDRIVVGSHPYQTTYIIQKNQLLLHFDKKLDDELIERFIAKQKLQARPATFQRSVDTLRAAKMRWIVVPESDKPLIEISRTLSKLPEVTMTTPVYYAEGQGPESASSPMPDTIIIRFRNKIDRAILDQLEGLGLSHNDRMSQLLTPFHYFSLKLLKGDVEKGFDLVGRIAKMKEVENIELDWLKLETYQQVIPNDTLWANQWDMTRINLPNAWTIETGNANVWVAIIDSGFDLTHPDLVYTPNTGGNLTHFNADQAIAGNPPPYNAGPSGVPHGTAVAGLAAAIINNATGVAGVAGGVSIMPVRLGTSPTAARVAAGINWAATNGARVASLSLSTTATAAAIAAVANAWTAGLVLCAATGNNGGDTTSPAVGFPASHANVIAVGATDQADERKRPASADNECWGSQFGAELDVMAPGVLCWTTDEQGANGYNNNGGAMRWACVNYPSTGDAAGNYIALFNGTSAATPHVAGLAALLISQYPTLTNQQVRDIIERTCEKVNPGTYAYADQPGRPNGTWHQEMGYGRINAFHALDLADVMIKDWPGDTGVEPATPPGGNYYDFSDIVIRPIDDDVFVPSDPIQSNRVERGQTNYLYIGVTNNGPREARNVVVTARITAYVGMQFVYPTDWTDVDATHISPTPVTATFAAIPPSGTARAKFIISSAQVDTLWGWKSGMHWSPCVLAAVNADNDYAFIAAALTGGSLVRWRNNLAQRNLSVVDVTAGAVVTFPLLAGNLQNIEGIMEILIERSPLLKGMQLLLSLDEDGQAFPLVDLTPSAAKPAERGGKIVFLECTKIEVALGCCHGVLTLEKGSHFDCLPPAKIGIVSVKGGEVITRDDKRFVEVREDVAMVRIEKQPNQLYPLALHTTIPADAKKGQRYMIRVAQRNEREEIVGGATVIYIVE